MASLSDLSSSSLIKLVVAGLSGTRKTTGLASLARAGYNLYILDCDNGLGALIKELAGDKAALARVQVEQCIDEVKNINGTMQISSPKAWNRAMNVLTNWPGKGALEKWTDADVLVIDTLTTLGGASLANICALTNHIGAPSQPDWGAAMNQIEKLIQLLASPAANCHVVINSHVTYTETADGSGVIEGFPSSLGNKLSPKIPVYFDNVLVADKVGKGENAKFVYKLRGTQLVMGKSSYRTAAELPNETGLATLFQELRGGKVPPKNVPTPTPQ